jgi:hypothetical protein
VTPGDRAENHRTVTRMVTRIGIVLQPSDTVPLWLLLVDPQAFLTTEGDFGRTDGQSGRDLGRRHLDTAHRVARSAGGLSLTQLPTEAPAGRAASLARLHGRCLAPKVWAAGRCSTSYSGRHTPRAVGAEEVAIRPIDHLVDMTLPRRTSNDLARASMQSRRTAHRRRRASRGRVDGPRTSRSATQ